MDNTYYVVEAVPDSKAKNAVVSAYMETAKKEALSPKSLDAEKTAPNVMSKTDLEILNTSNTNIPNQSENVNDLLPSSLTNSPSESILNPYLNAYYNYLNSATSDAQNPNAFPKTLLSRDEQLGRYFDEAWDTEDFVSPL